jgi:hypothetical protein
MYLFWKGSKAGRSLVVKIYGILKNSWSPTGMDRLNFHFLPPYPTRSRDVSGDGQSALVDKLEVSSSRYRLPGPHRYHSGIVQQAQVRSSETAVSTHHNSQSTIYKPLYPEIRQYISCQWWDISGYSRETVTCKSKPILKITTSVRVPGFTLTNQWVLNCLINLPLLWNQKFYYLKQIEFYRHMQQIYL